MHLMMPVHLARRSGAMFGTPPRSGTFVITIANGPAVYEIQDSMDGVFNTKNIVFLREERGTLIGFLKQHFLPVVLSIGAAVRLTAPRKPRPGQRRLCCPRRSPALCRRPAIGLQSGRCRRSPR